MSIPQEPKTPLWMRFTAATFALLILAGVLIAPLMIFAKAPLLEAESGKMNYEGVASRYVSRNVNDIEVLGPAVLVARGGARLIVEEKAKLSVREDGDIARIELVSGEIVVQREAKDRECRIMVGGFALTINEAVELYLRAGQLPEMANGGASGAGNKEGDALLGGAVESGGVHIRCAPELKERIANHPEYAPEALFGEGLRIGKGNAFGSVSGIPFVSGPGMQLNTAPKLPAENP